MDALVSPAGLLCAAALIASLIPTTSAIRDPDFWWHLRTGQLIAAGHSLLDTDPYTYTATGHHWVMHEWLTEVLYAALHAVGGIALIVGVLCAVTWAGLICLATRAALPLPEWRPSSPARPDARRPSPVLVGLGMVAAAIAGYPIWGPRAQMITFTCTCLTLLLVERHLRQGSRAIWLLVPLFLVWGNLHSGFIIGAGFLLLILGAEAAGGHLGWPGTAARDRVLTLARVIAACAAVVVLNPNGPQIYLYPFQTQGSSAQQALILEWHSPDFHDPAVAAFGVMLLSLGVMTALTRRVRPRDAALALATTAMALQSVRHIALFIAATTPLWIEQMDLLLLRLRAARRDREQRPAPGRTRVPPPAWFRAAMAAIVILPPLALLGGRLATATAVREDSLVYAKDMPVCASRWLATAPAGLRIFNQYGEGGYLALHLTPMGDRIFIFGDAALMGDDLLRRYGSVESVSPGWQSVIDAAGSDLVLFDNDTPLVDVMSRSPRWQQVYHDGHNTAFVRTDAAGERLRARLAPQPAFTAPGDPCTDLGSTPATAAMPGATR